MTIQDAIRLRHSVRKYISKPLPEDVVETLRQKIDECNSKGCLHIQLVTNETKAFTGVLSYGSFKGVENYFAVVGKKGDSLDERAGYYGEQLVLLAQTLGLNTCWVALTYRKVKSAYQIGEGEKLVCMIALGYGVTQGVLSKSKAIEQVSNVSDTTPAWFIRGVEAALLAPTAVNQQKFFLELTGEKRGEKSVVKTKTAFSLPGNTHVDLGIVKLHFEIGAGTDNFSWADE